MTEGNFVDYVKIYVSSGKGGKGSSRLHREEFIEKGGPHKRWSMWFNSMQREEPYLLLTSTEETRDGLVPSGTVRQVLHGCRQLVL